MSIQLSDEQKAHLKYLSEKLTYRQKCILRAKSLGFKQREIAFILGVSAPAVCKHLKKIQIVVKDNEERSYSEWDLFLEPVPRSSTLTVGAP